MRALAITSPARIARAGRTCRRARGRIAGADARILAGVLAPAGTPPEIVGKLNPPSTTPCGPRNEASHGQARFDARSARRRISRQFIAEEFRAGPRS